MSKKIPIAIPVLLLIGIVSSFASPGFLPVSANNSANTTFQVNITEALSVSIDTPINWDSGEINTFLRNKIDLTVASNNAAGFTASMFAQNSTSLAHSSKNGVSLSTMNSSTTRASFPSNTWGYSLKNNVTDNNNIYGETDLGNPSSNYYPVTASTSPITILKNATSGELNQSIYFGAKSDISQASGTYSGTIIINVVSGVISNENPITPTNPATPSNDTPNDSIATYDSTNNRTIYTTTATTSTTSNITTNINAGDITNSYTPPQGVTDSTSSNIYDGSMLTTGLAITASVAAASGIFFFILAKRKKDDDEEETV